MSPPFPSSPLFRPLHAWLPARVAERAMSRVHILHGIFYLTCAIPLRTVSNVRQQALTRLRYFHPDIQPVIGVAFLSQHCCDMTG